MLIYSKIKNCIILFVKYETILTFNYGTILDMELC